MAMVVATIKVPLEYVVYMRKFPCPYCKGQGGEIEIVIEETREGPYYDCGICEGQGMIPIGGRIHQMIKDWKDYGRPTAKERLQKKDNHRQHSNEDECLDQDPAGGYEGRRTK